MPQKLNHEHSISNKAFSGHAWHHIYLKLANYTLSVITESITVSSLKDDGSATIEYIVFTFGTLWQFRQKEYSMNRSKEWITCTSLS